jgi:hypothetical protein
MADEHERPLRGILWLVRTRNSSQHGSRTACLPLKCEPLQQGVCVVVEFNGRCAYGRTGVVREEHHTSGFRKACREEVFKPELVALRPGFSRVIGGALKVETVDCHNASIMVCQCDVEEPRVKPRAKERTRSPQPWKAGYRGRCQR